MINSHGKCVVLPILSVIFLWADSPALAEYSEPASFLKPACVLTIGAAYGLAAQGDDSTAFQEAIDDVAKAGGGKVVVPVGDYELAGVHLRSDVHLVFDGPSTIHPFVKGQEGQIAIFSIGAESLTKNTSIRGINGWTRFVFDNHRRLRAFMVVNARNFLLSNFNIEDTRTTFSAVELTWGGKNDDGSFKIPTGGTVQHLRNSNAHYGYGTIQVQSGKNVLFKDIQSVGGVSLRLETGWKTMNAAKTGGVFDIRADNISIYSGQAAVMFMPHSMHNGAVYAKNIRSMASEYAVLVEKGSLHKFNKKEIAELGLTEGTFDAIHVEGVEAWYSDGPIQTRWVHLHHYPRILHANIYRVPASYSKAYRGPAIAAVSVPDLKAAGLKIEDVVAHGFAYHPSQIDDSNHYRGSSEGMFREGKPSKGRLLGDIDDDQRWTIKDLDLLFDAFGAVEVDGPCDLAKKDGVADLNDVAVWLHEVMGSKFGDANLDGRVTAADVAILAASFGKSGGWGEGNFNGDKIVDLKDLAILRSRYDVNPPGGGIPFSEAASRSGLPVN